MVCACVRVLDHGICLLKSAEWLQAKGIQSQNKKLQHEPPDFPCSPAAVPEASCEEQQHFQGHKLIFHPTFCSMLGRLELE